MPKNGKPQAYIEHTKLHKRQDLMQGWDKLDLSIGALACWTEL